MMNTPQPLNSDTICAISTPPGVGGIAVARVSGPDAIAIVQRLWTGRPIGQWDSHTAHLGTVNDSQGQPLDQAVATLFRGPHSFTGDDVIEIAVHGSRFVQRELIASLMAAGARLAEPGEFTRRAFAAGHLNLAQAEAVADVIASTSRAAHRIALTQMRGGYTARIEALRSQLVELASLLELELDFSEEDVEFADRSHLRTLATDLMSQLTTLHQSFATGRAIKEGIPVAIVGATNAGKSSLLNAILGDDRAIVSDIHGTTRDTIEETIELSDYTLRLIDTAGLRQTPDTIEQIGIDRSIQAIGRAHIILILIDTTAPLPADLLTTIGRALEQNPQARPILLLNKSDLPPLPDTIARATAHAAAIGAPAINISATTDQGLDRLTSTITSIIEASTAPHADILVTNARHAAALLAAAQSTERIIQGLDQGIPSDLVAQDVRATIDTLSTITGQIPSTEILSTIFSRFCIGK